MEQNKGRLTIPTDLDVVPETLELMARWGADAIRDADGTQFPPQLANTGAKVYATYYTTRKDNDWARENPDEVQQCYIMTAFHAAGESGPLTVPLMAGISQELMCPNHSCDTGRWWEVIDRTTGQVVPPAGWRYDPAAQTVQIEAPIPWHEYTVSFLAWLIWDPVHMYNAVVNGWQGEHQITFDVRMPKTRAWSLERLRRFLQDNPQVDVVRFTTFFHQFTLVFDELKREKYVDWYGYSASVNPVLLEQFEAEAGYPFRAEYIIDQGYYNNQYRVPTREYLDFMAFQRREVAALAKEMVDIVHQAGREAMMFLGDHWIGTEPYLDEFAAIGLDAVVGSVGNGSTLRLIADIPGVKYTEGRFLPYFFPDTFHPGGDPTAEARENWVTARRAILRKPIDRIGYGGYLKLALDFPDLIDYIEKVADEFRMLYENISGTKPFCHGTVAVLNAWGKMRSWGAHMVHHALYQKQNYSYAGVIEALSGAPFEVRFISFEDILAAGGVPAGIDVLINVGDMDTAHSGGTYWADERIVTAVRRYIAGGGGFVGVGEPTACQWQGHTFQLANALGMELERGFTLGYDKYNWDEQPHFITEDAPTIIDFGEEKGNIYALPGTTVLRQKDKSVQLAANNYGAGRCVYLSGLPYSFENNRLLHRALLWSCRKEAALHRWFSKNLFVEVHAYPGKNQYCVVNNTGLPQQTTVWREGGSSFACNLAGNEIKWFPMDQPHAAKA
ncbi:1,3-beta-galactosyl-N-acetylhexosamine phosphorylase [Ruminococcaceae bacterium OttesenSCG-928-D13]|nr:1,3-beta-galactosyl-N-acetylhexosamine phosphorylase [Ruminococcaceae bacterium OttesenSCG-928-D13]